MPHEATALGNFQQFKLEEVVTHGGKQYRIVDYGVLPAHSGAKEWHNYFTLELDGYKRAVPEIDLLRVNARVAPVNVLDAIAVALYPPVTVVSSTGHGETISPRLSFGTWKQRNEGNGQ
jgi:hypothetical protein